MRLGQLNGGHPGDWTDVRLNTFGLLTLLAVYVVLGRNSQPDGVESGIVAAFGLGFVLVPVTYIATRIWTIRHPGPWSPQGTRGPSTATWASSCCLAISFTMFISATC